MSKLLNIYIVSFKNNLASRIAYRGDFCFSMMMILVSELFMPIITLLIYRTGAAFPGWDVYEVLILQGIFMLSKGIASALFFGMVYNTLDGVRAGTYDLFLIKPCSTLFLSIASGFQIDSLGTILGAVFTLFYSLTHITPPNLLEWLGFFMLLILSIISILSFALIMAGSVFKWVGNGRVYEIYDSLTAFGNYPRSIFSKAFQGMISYIIPVAMIGFFPASVLLGKEINGVMISSMVCILFLILSIAYWKFMLSNYTSAGG